MLLFFRYLKLEFKRSILVYGKMLVTTVAVIAGIALLSMVLAFSMKHLSGFESVSVGMVIPQEEADPDTVFAVRFLEAMDSVKSVSSFTYYQNEQVALGDLRAGKLKTVISLPPYFFEDVDTGMNTPAKIYIPSNASLSTRVFVELLKDGVHLLQLAEAGAYAFLDVAYEDRPYNQSFAEAGNVVAYAYVTEVLLRGNVFDKEVISAIGTVSYELYYMAAGMLILLLLSGWNFAHLFQKKSIAFRQKLEAEGLGKIKRSLIWVFIMTVLIWAQALVLYGVMYVTVRMLSYQTILLDGMIPLGLLLLAFCIAAYFFMVYAIAGGEAAGCSVLFVGNLFMIIGAGLIIPISYLPSIFSKIATFVPLYQWDRMALDIFWGEIHIERVFVQLSIAFAMLMAGGAVIWKNH